MSDAAESHRIAHPDSHRPSGLHHQAAAELSRPKSPRELANEREHEITERLNREQAIKAEAFLHVPAPVAQPANAGPAQARTAPVENPRLVANAPVTATKSEIADNCARGFSLDLGIFRIGEQHPDKRCLASTTSAINADRQAVESQLDHDQMRTAEQRPNNKYAGQVATEANAASVHQAQMSQYNHLVHTYIEHGANPANAAAQAGEALGWNHPSNPVQQAAYRPVESTQRHYPAGATTAQLNEMEAQRAERIASAANVPARIGPDGWREAPATGTVVTRPGDVFAVSPGTSAVVREGATVMARNGASIFVQGGHGVFSGGSSGVVSGGEVEIYPGANVRVIGPAKVIYRNQQA